MWFVALPLGCPRYTDRLRILQAWLLLIRLNSYEQRQKPPSRSRREWHRGSRHRSYVVCEGAAAAQPFPGQFATSRRSIHSEDHLGGVAQMPVPRMCRGPKKQPSSPSNLVDLVPRSSVVAEICLSSCVNWMMNRWVQHPSRRQGDLDMVEFRFRLIVEYVELHFMQI